MSTEDVVVIGAGLAGAAAAEELARRGLGVLVLEARERVGGRGYARPFEGTDEILDFGGSWITPWQATIRDACARHGIALRPRHPVTSRRWWRDGGLHTDGPASPRDQRRHEIAIARIAMDCALHGRGHDSDEKGRPLTDISLADYLARIGAPECTHHLVGAWWTVSGNGDKRRVPAAELLASCGHGDGTPEGICEAWAESLVGGVSLLAERLLGGIRVLRSAPVATIAHEAGGVAVRTVDGTEHRARAAIVATGLNPMAAIRFEPALPPAKARALDVGHLGRAVKVWVRVTGVPVGVLATGGGDGLELMLAERTLADGSTMLVGFGLAGDGFDPDRPGDIARMVGRFFPEAHVIGSDWHDWVADPHSRGTWVASVLGGEAGLEAATWQPEGRLAFATSDFAAEGQGWLEGAMTSGLAAADAIARRLGNR